MYMEENLYYYYPNYTIKYINNIINTNDVILNYYYDIGFLTNIPLATKYIISRRLNNIIYGFNLKKIKSL
jgi:uncharacterized protein (UPF0333 family)